MPHDKKKEGEKKKEENKTEDLGNDFLFFTLVLSSKRELIIAVDVRLQRSHEVAC